MRGPITHPPSPIPHPDEPIYLVTSFLRFCNTPSKNFLTFRRRNSFPANQSLHDCGVHSDFMVSWVWPPENCRWKKTREPTRASRSAQPKVVGAVRSTISNCVARPLKLTLTRLPLRSGPSLWTLEQRGSQSGICAGSVIRLKTRLIGAGTAPDKISVSVRTY